jgi:histidinol-phosphatase (PHP family)
MIYRTDYHVHSLHSDGKSAPEDYIAPAVAAGLKELGFADHMTLFKGPLNWSMDKAEAAEFVNHINSLKNNIRDIKVRTGVEVDYFPGMEEETRKVLKNLDLDYALGSVHYLGESTVDLGPQFYEGKNIDSLFENYFAYVSAAAASGMFDIIAHCDLVRIFGFRPSVDPEPAYRKLAISLRMYDMAFELNTNGRNKPVADFYPDRRFLKIFREEGVPVCVNSDAHNPSMIAQYFDEAYDLLREAGFTEMAVFEKRKRYMIPFR